MPSPSRVRKLFALDARGWHDILTAQMALIDAQWRLHREPNGAFVARARSAGEAVSGDPERARELALALGRAAENGFFRPKCLVRSLALRDLLERNGIFGSSIRIGVRRRDGEFQAHAWILWGNTVLGDRDDHVAGFTEVDDMRVLG
jgi:hypothetical protein